MLGIDFMKFERDLMSKVGNKNVDSPDHSDWFRQYVCMYVYL